LPTHAHSFEGFSAKNRSFDPCHEKVICRRSVHLKVIDFISEKKKGPAIQKFIADKLRLTRRREISHKFLSGEWSVDLPSIEKLRKDRAL